jgi:hypothetical protein
MSAKNQGIGLKLFWKVGFFIKAVSLFAPDIR